MPERPDWRGEIRQRLAELQLDAAREAQIVDEMAQHLDDRYEELLRHARRRSRS
jgi:putative ABC transport system permease protein